MHELECERVRDGVPLLSLLSQPFIGELVAERFMVELFVMFVDGCIHSAESRGVMVAARAMLLVAPIQALTGDHQQNQPEQGAPEGWTGVSAS